MSTKEIFAKRISEILIQQKAITRDIGRGMEEAFGRSSEDEFDNFILQEGFVDREQLLNALTVYYNIPFVDVTGRFFDRELLRNFPKDFLVRNGIIPMEEDENLLVVIAAEPERDGLESAIRTFSPLDVAYRVGIRRDIIDAVQEYYDKAVTEVQEDQDLNEEHREQNQATLEIMEEKDGEIEFPDDMSEEDDIR